MLSKIKLLWTLLIHKPFPDRIIFRTLSDAESIAISGAITENELKLVTSIYQLGFDAGYNKGMEEGGDIINGFDDLI